MKFSLLHSRPLQTLILCGLLLRVAVPSGFMSGALSDGWYLKLCPDGMPANVMTALLGHDHHHHHADASVSSFAQCDLGGIGIADAPLVATACLAPTPELVQVTSAAPLLLAIKKRFFHLPFSRTSYLLLISNTPLWGID